MNFQAMHLSRFSFLALSVLTALSTGCSTPDVGAPCLPEQIPADGFNEAEAYIESSSVQCETRVCMVYQLNGDPRPTCIPPRPDQLCPVGDNDCVEPPLCADQAKVEERVYCTCRCDAGESGFAECECPDGFSCEPVLEQGGPGVRGSYCVRNGTFD